MKKLAFAAFVAASLAFNVNAASANDYVEKICIERGDIKICVYPK